MVHAKAAGAWGEFEVTHDVSDLTDANFLSHVGKKTKVLTRISTVAGEKGSSDTVRDVRGWYGPNNLLSLMYSVLVRGTSYCSCLRQLTE